MSLSLATGGSAPAERHPARRDAARWGASLAFVLISHGCAGWLLLRQASMPVPEAAPPAVILDLAPAEPAPQPEPAPEPAPEAAPPAPAQPAAEATPPEPAPPEPAPPEPTPPEPQPPEPPPLDPPPPEPQPAEAAIETPPPPPPPKRPPPRPAPPRPRQVQPKAAPAPAAEAPPAEAAPTAAATPAHREASAAATQSWQGRLQAHLARFKRYPAEARMRHHEGTPVVRFVMTRTGRVLSFRLEQGSGHELLDQEAVALIERAQPLPPLPEELPQATIELVLPLRFQLR